MRMTVLALMLVGCDLGDGPGDDVSDSSMEWVEVCGNGIDDDSDGLTDCEDEACDGDCPEDCEDARDNDGDGLTDCDDEDCSEWCVVDEDGDGFEPLAMGGLDCDDGDPDVHPNAVEVCDEGVDNDCNGVADDEDPDVDPETMTRWYRDLDDDGYGLAEVFEDGCAEPPLSSANDTDCRDFDPDVNPGATEVCNEIDDDCDDLVDQQDPSLDPASKTIWYPDEDLDGYGDEALGIASCLQVGEYIDVGGDCDDEEVNTNPGMYEICDQVDNDCNGMVDDNPLVYTWYEDNDGDGYGDPLSGQDSCEDWSVDGYRLNDQDCDDTDPDVHPMAAEVCDGGIDNDCDGLIDSADPDVHPADHPNWYQDLDGDGYGNSQVWVTQCIQPIGTSLDGTDCNDEDAEIHPGAEEVCNEWDDDCDGLIDGDDSSFDIANFQVFYQDDDGDGWGTDAFSVLACEAPMGFASVDGDCDDELSAVNPGVAELCDGVDNNCNGIIDDNPLVFTWHFDADNDGFGDPIQAIQDCQDLSAQGYTLNDLDCDDGDAQVNPQAIETCNSVDDDCDTLVDEDDPSLDLAGLGFYADDDGDGYGNPDVIPTSCAITADFVSNSDDCNDGNMFINPSMVEVCNGVDDDCDQLVDDPDPDIDPATQATWYGDLDGDGYGTPYIYVVQCAEPPFSSLTADDCNDNDPFVNPGSDEVCNDRDDNCNGLIDMADPGLDLATLQTFWADLDNDGFGGSITSIEMCSAVEGYEPTAVDCDDTHIYTYPDAPELCDGLDNDCNGLSDDNIDTVDWLDDIDGDGYGDDGVVTSACQNLSFGNYTLVGGDCDDSDGAIYPGATEQCRDLVDNDCDGVVDRPLGEGSVDATLADATFFGEGDDHRAGVSVAAGGDIDGDGFPDLLIGAHYADPGGTNSGKAYVVYGPIDGLIDLGNAGGRIAGEDGWDYAGLDVAGPGDVNGDGFDDVLVGAYGAEDENLDLVGVAYLVYGPIWDRVDLWNADAKIRGTTDGGMMGYSVSGAGDVNGDGYADLLIGAHGQNVVYLVHGPVYGELDIENTAVATIEGAADSNTGFDVAGLGDIDNDGYADIIIGAFRDDRQGLAAGAAFVFYGPLGGSLSVDDADAILVGERGGDWAGYSVAGPGDVNGDGYGDILVGARNESDTVDDAGAAYLVLGPVFGQFGLGTANAMLIGETPFAAAGHSVTGAGDINGDGSADLLIGAPLEDSGPQDGGSAYVVLGPVTGNHSLGSAVARVNGINNGDELGIAVSPAGDVNLDGFDDIIVGAWKYDGGGWDSGAAFLFMGCATD